MMQSEQLGYDYRSDGHFLVRQQCSYCGKPCDAYALQNQAMHLPTCRECERKRERHAD